MMTPRLRSLVIAAVMLTPACTSLPEPNPSRFGEAQQDLAVNSLKQMELIFHSCSTLRLDVVKIELTDTPDQERWSVLSCTGEENCYLLTRNQDGTIAIEAPKTGKKLIFK